MAPDERRSASREVGSDRLTTSAVMLHRHWVAPPGKGTGAVTALFVGAVVLHLITDLHQEKQKSAAALHGHSHSPLEERRLTQAGRRRPSLRTGAVKG